MKFYILIMMMMMTITVLSLSVCNPAGEDISDPLWNSLHNSKPFQSSFFHSADYRFPHKACDETQCHGISLAGGNSGSPSCYSCHDDQWTIFGISHTKKISGYYHRYNVDDYPADRTSNAGWFATCRDLSCHGGSLDGNQGGPSANFAYRYSCKVCHTGFTPNTIPPPGHRIKKSEEGESGWHHYKYEAGWNDFSYCSGNACHGSSKSVTGSAVSSIAGLAGHGPRCEDCH